MIMSDSARRSFRGLAARAARPTPCRTGLLHLACCCPQTGNSCAVSNQRQRLPKRRLLTAPLFALPWISSSLALLEYRRGNDLKATTLCTRCLSSPDCDAPRAALAHVIQALAYWRLGQYAEGFTELSRAQERIDLAFKNGLNLNPNNDPAQNWFDWVIGADSFTRVPRAGFGKRPFAGTNDSAAPSVESAAKYRVLGEWHAVRQEWRDAAERLGVLVEVDRVDGWETITLDYFKLSLALIEAGKRDDFNRFREEIVARYGHTTNATAANRVIKSSLLLPAPRQLLELLEPYARACEEGITNSSVYVAAWNSLSLALLEYRQGNYARASNLCRKCLAYPESNALWTTTAQLILAMSYWQMHQYREAVPKMIEAQEQSTACSGTGLIPTRVTTLNIIGSTGLLRGFSCASARSRFCRPTGPWRKQRCPPPVWQARPITARWASGTPCARSGAMRLSGSARS